MSTRRVWINEDNAHFYDCRGLEHMTVEGLEALVDTYADGTNVEGILFCVNVQRALFDSKAWEPLYHDYDPHGPDDQPGLMFLPPIGRSLTPDKRGRHWVHALWLLKQRGIDHPAVWLQRCRHHGVEGWLSMRMNDCHHNPDEGAFWHPTLWKQRRDLRRGAYRDEGWFEGAFDYAKPEVFDHHLRLVAELCERYDFDGLELDWVRWVLHFAPGGEQPGAAILTDFMRRARSLIDQAARRRGHPVKLGVRLPSEVPACLQLGYDVLTWAQEKLVDQIALAPFFQQCQYEWPIPLWRAIVGPDVKLLCQSESVTRPFPEVGTSDVMLDYELFYGSAASAHQQGADGIYLFNECYRESPGDGLARKFPGLPGRLFNETGDHEALRDMPRRQAVSYAQIVGPGMASASPLPIPLTKPEGSWEFGRQAAFIPLRICMGGRPRHREVLLRLGFDDAVPALSHAQTAVWVNAKPLSTPATDRPGVILPQVVAYTLAWRVPGDMLCDDVNIIEFLPPPNSPGRLVWAELAVLGPSPTPR